MVLILLLEIYQLYQSNVIGSNLLLLVLVVQGLVIYYTHVRVHCNTGYSTIVLHNKNVALEGFFCGCKPTRLNHVTLVFSMFLFYASPSASTLAYTTQYNTLLLIYLTQYQSQTSFLASNKNLQQAKKILMCTSLSEVTHIYLLDLDSITSHSHHGSMLCQNPTTKQVVT